MTVGLPSMPVPPGPSADSPASGARRWLGAALIALVVAGGAGVAWWQTRQKAQAGGRPAASAFAPLTDTTARAPAGVRVRVRVVNVGGVSGLARRATQHLRDYGFDVVDFASGRTDSTAVSRITVHTGHSDWGARVQKALGVGTVGTDSDSSRYVDITVFLGRDWRPSAEPLRP